VGPAAGARITGVVLVTHDGRKGGINRLAGSKIPPATHRPENDYHKGQRRGMPLKEEITGRLVV